MHRREATTGNGRQREATGGNPGTTVAEVTGGDTYCTAGRQREATGGNGRQREAIPGGPGLLKLQEVTGGNTYFTNPLKIR